MRLCARCGREAPIFRFRTEHLRLIGWQPYHVEAYMNWCGHGQEFISWPQEDGTVQLVPLVGEAV